MVLIVISMTEMERWGENDNMHAKKASKIKGANRDRWETNRGRFAAIALPRSYRPVLPRDSILPVPHIYLYTSLHVSITYLSTNAVPCPAITFRYFLLLTVLSFFLSFDIRKSSIILILSIISNFYIFSSYLKTFIWLNQCRPLLYRLLLAVIYYT